MHTIIDFLPFNDNKTVTSCLSDLPSVSRALVVDFDVGFVVVVVAVVVVDVVVVVVVDVVIVVVVTAMYDKINTDNYR